MERKSKKLKKSKKRENCKFPVVHWFGRLSNRNMKGWKSSEASGVVVVCVGCGSSLTEFNRSIDSKLCKNCWMVNLAELEAEDNGF